MAGVQVIGLAAFLGVLNRAQLIARQPFGRSTDAQALAEAFRAHEQKVFATEGQAQGQRWAPLKASTLRYRRPGPILQQSGRLKRSLTTAGTDSDVRITGRRLTFGSNVPYAQYHQRGTKNMKARPPIKATPALAQALGAVFAQRMAKRLNR